MMIVALDLYEDGEHWRIVLALRSIGARLRAIVKAKGAE